MSNKNDKILVEVKDLKMHFPISMGWMFKKTIGHVKAVDGISFKIARGETLGLVGESGCGKTTTGRVILQLERPTSGHIFFEGKEITGIEEKALRNSSQENADDFPGPLRFPQSPNDRRGNHR